MAERTRIEWADHTFNPWTGCTKVSPACDHCYAEAWAKRSGHVAWGPQAKRRRTTVAAWNQPLKWNAALQGTGRRDRVFCASLADVFDNHASIAPDWRADLWTLIEGTANLDWLLLTKRPMMIPRMVPADWLRDGFPRNVWLGTTVENQVEANRRIEPLLAMPAAVHFLSCEPLLDEIYLAPWLSGLNTPGMRRLGWVIAGGESGHGWRAVQPNWLRSLRDQCIRARVPFFFKQWGGRTRAEIHAKGRSIDGREFNEMPKGENT